MIKVQPISPDMVEVVVDGKKLQDEYQDYIIDTLDDFAEQYPGQTQVILNANGFRMTAPVVNKATELAGLDGFAEAKQIATGEVIF